MQKIRISVDGVQAQLTEAPVLTSGMVGLQVDFTFDDSWEGLEKTAVFRAGNESRLVRNLQESTVVPWEVMLKKNCNLCVGVYGAREDGTLAIPTVWVEAGAIRPGTDPSGDTATEPTLPIWQQALDAAQLAVETAAALRRDAEMGAFDGYSPVRGQDYWTEADKNEIKGYVDAAILGGAW